MSDKNLDALLRLDALSTAEKLTGETCDEPDTFALGFAMHVKKYELLEEKLKAANDSRLSTPVQEYLKIIADLGFREVLKIPFLAPSAGVETSGEYYVYFQDKGGVLLAFDTHYGNVNSGHYYYNWRPNDGVPGCQDALESGGWYGIDGEVLRNPGPETKFVWAGYHDCREAIRHHMEMLEEAGSFVTPWVKRPYIHLNHWGDQKLPGYANIQGPSSEWLSTRITNERMARLPADVIAALGPDN